MIQCTCIVQQDQRADQRKSQLEDVLGSFTRRTFGELAEVRWVSIRPDFGFTAGRTSTSSIVSMSAPRRIEPILRGDLLLQVCNDWMNVTGCSIDEIVAVISDPAN